MSYAGEEKDNKEGEHITKCTIRKKTQTIVSISVVKEELHTKEKNARLPFVKLAKLWKNTKHEWNARPKNANLLVEKFKE